MGLTGVKSSDMNWSCVSLEFSYTKDNLMAGAAPAADQAAALGHDPQQVTCGRIAEFPVGIGRLALNQGHAISFLVWGGHQSA